MLCKFTRCGQFFATTCVAIAILSSGCRSAQTSGRNLFGFRSEPSAEALAGTGPTTTYPVPPSASATPEAIASIAGGTVQPSNSPVTTPSASPSQIAISTGTPSDVSPASDFGSNNGPNMAAAQANGMYGQTKPAGFAAPNWTMTGNELAKTVSAEMKIPEMKVPEMKIPDIKVPQVTAANLQIPSADTSGLAASIPSGYQFGSTQPAVEKSTASDKKTASMTVPSAYTIPSTSSNTSTKSPASGVKSNGFQLPGDTALNNVVNTAAGVSASLSDNAAKWASSSTVGDIATNNFQSVGDLPAASQPEARISSAASSGSYMPGSTSGSSGYPGASDGYPNPSTGGSYLR
ncbi:MAG: hypothetical protein WBD20_03620 [Pirellulaceae bacterium]